MLGGRSGGALDPIGRPLEEDAELQAMEIPLGSPQHLVFRVEPNDRAGVAHTAYFSYANGQRWATTRRVTGGWLNRLSQLVGMDEGEDRAFDLYDGHDHFVLRGITQLGDHVEGSVMLLENPVGTGIGRIRRNQQQAQAVNVQGDLLLSVAHQGPQGQRGRPILDRQGKSLGSWLTTLEPVTDNLLDEAVRWDWLMNQDTTAGPGFAQILIRLEGELSPDLRPFLVGMLMAACVGYGNEGRWPSPT